MSCEMNTHPVGVEIRTYQTGEFQPSQVFESTELAEAEAAQRKREFTMDGGQIGLQYPNRPHLPPRRSSEKSGIVSTLEGK